MPFFYVASWILMIVGPLCFPKGYQIYCFVIIGYSLVKTALICLSLGYAIYRLKKVIKRYQRPDAGIRMSKKKTPITTLQSTMPSSSLVIRRIQSSCLKL